MHSALKDKTNSKIKMALKRTAPADDKTKVVSYLKEVTNHTKDFNLKYDLTKCVEILEGKENQDYKDLKEELEMTLMEKEVMFKEKCELAVELDFLKSYSQNDEE